MSGVSGCWPDPRAQRPASAGPARTGRRLELSPRLPIMCLQKEETMKRRHLYRGGIDAVRGVRSRRRRRRGENEPRGRLCSTATRPSRETSRQAAEAMPEADYGFSRLTRPDLRDVWPVDRPPGRQPVHQLRHPQGRRPSPSPASNEKKATKAELVKALADAFAFCDGAMSSLTDQNALQMIKQGEGETARGAVVSALLSHAPRVATASPSCICAQRVRCRPARLAWPWLRGGAQ